MTRPPRQCLGCGRLTHNGPRCPDCRAHLRAELNSGQMRALRPDVRAGKYGPCRHCGSWSDLTVGHDVARSQGGTLAHGWGVECRPCNSQRSKQGTS